MVLLDLNGANGGEKALCKGNFFCMMYRGFLVCFLTPFLMALTCRQIIINNGRRTIRGFSTLHWFGLLMHVVGLQSPCIDLQWTTNSSFLQIYLKGCNTRTVVCVYPPLGCSSPEDSFHWRRMFFHHMLHLLRWKTF